MKRPAGIVASAVVLALASVFHILVSLGIAIVGATYASPATPRGYFFAVAAGLLLIAAWGIVTAIGVPRCRPWARTSMLVTGGCAAGMGVSALLGLLAAGFMQLPPVPGIDPALARTSMQSGLLIGAACFSIPLALGIWWLVYFNRKPIRALYAGPAGELAEGGRPLLISVYVVFMLFGAAAYLLTIRSHTPAVLLTFVLHGWPRAAFQLTWAALTLAAGIGVWRLREWARRLALALLAYGVLQTILFMSRPSLMLALTAEAQRSASLAQAQTPFSNPTAFYSITFGFSLLFAAATAYLLHHYHARFSPTGRPAEHTPTPA